MIITKGFLVVDYGDPSVGIFKKEWEIKGDFIFNGRLDLELFRSDLKYFFMESLGLDSNILIKTFEEIDDDENKLYTYK
jgi:hypothetical protein